MNVVKRLALVWFIAWLALGATIMAHAVWLRWHGHPCPDGTDLTAILCGISRRREFLFEMMLGAAVCLLARIGTIVSHAASRRETAPSRP